MTDPQVISLLERINTNLTSGDIGDDTKVLYGDDDDFSQRYDSSSDEFRTRDEIADSDVTAVTKGGDYKVFGDTLYPDISGSPTFSTHDHSEGGMAAVDHTSLTGVTADNHHTRYTDEESQDATASLLVGGGKITASYDDGANTLTIDTSALDPEEVEDRVAAVTTGGDKVTVSHDDANDTITIDTSALDEEGVEDTVDTLVVGGDNISTVYDDVAGTLTFNVDQGAGSGLNADLVHGNYPLLNSDLTNGSVTIAGNSVSLGSSTTPDAADFDGSSGTNGQLLQTDGTTASWASVTADVTLEDNGTTVISTNNINFGSDLTVTDDGDGTATVDAAAGITDHGNLNGLGDDDHTQYLLVDGTRSMAGSLNLGGDLIATNGEVIWDESATYIPQGRLQNDSVTVAGNSVSLGGSTAINHSNLSNVASDQHHTRYADSEAISAVEGASFTSLDTANIVESATEHISLDGAGRVDLPNGNLRLATGNAIEDGSGTERFSLNSNYSQMKDAVGERGFQAEDGVGNFVFAKSGTPAAIFDEVGSYYAVQYDPDASAGVLRTPNAGVVVNSQNTSHGSDGMEFRWTGTESVIDSVNRSGTFSRSPIGINGSTVKLNSFGGLIDASANPANLRLATGQSIEDGSGTSRLGVDSNGTNVKDQNGQNVFQALDNAGTYINARPDTPIQFFDAEGSFTAVQYDTDTSAGVLRATNAAIAAQGNSAVPSGGTGVELYGGGNGIIQAYDRDATNHVDMEFGASLYDFTRNPANLRLATGQSIEDGSGTGRFSIFDTDQTFIRSGDGRLSFKAHAGNRNEVRAYSDQPFIINDQEGNFDAVSYSTSSSAPGTLSLDNADLQLDQFIRDNNGNDLLGAFPNASTPNTLFFMPPTAGSEFKIYAPAEGDDKFMIKDGGDINFYSGMHLQSNRLKEFEGLASADSMTANPEADTEDGYMTVEKGGVTYQVPMYRA